MDKRTKLVEARARNNWNLEQAAERIGCAPNTLDRWELGTMKPAAYYRARLCEVYGITTEELGLEEEKIIAFPKRSKDIQTFLYADLTTRLQDLALVTHCKPYKVQRTIVHALKEFSAMNAGHEDVVLTRREALRRLAMFPVVLSSGATQQPLERILNACAAGITACEQLSKREHEDISLAFSMLNTYLPVLKTIVKESSTHRKDAASLTAQAYLLRHILGLHIESPDVAIARGYAKLAVTYGEQSNDPSLQIATLKNLTWAYNHVKNYPQALRTIEQAKSLAERYQKSLPPTVTSRVYGTVAVIQVKNGIDPSYALDQAEAAYSLSPPGKYDLNAMDFGYAQLMRDNGLAHYYQGKYNDALVAFARVIDPNDLTSKMPMPVRTYVELLNNQTMAALKSPDRDMEQVITCWKASVKGAVTLQSQQRFDEAYMAYEVMAGIWPKEKAIANLREHIIHW
jgi:transcriptional regulator with XRE-family HTH domain